jgi:hypothetical protein
VRVVQTLRRLLRERRRDLGGNRTAAAAAGDDRRQIFAGQVLHADEVFSVDLAELVGGDDVRMFEARRDARLIQEHLLQLRAVGEVGEDAFERDDLYEALDATPFGDVEPTHPALAEQAEQPVTAECLSHVSGHVS